MKELMINEDFSDVTLVTEDKKQIKANVNILSACSPVFKDIFKKEKNSSTIMYLRGIQFSEMEPIIQFIYLGEVTLNYERINEFLNVSKNLDIKEIGKNVVNKEEKAEKLNEIETLDENDLLQSEVETESIDGSEFSFIDSDEVRNYGSGSILDESEEVSIDKSRGLSEDGENSD